MSNTGRKRMIAWFLAAVMVLAFGLMPGGLPRLKVRTVIGDDAVYSLNPSAEIASVEKKAEIAAGNYGTDGFFTLTGNATRGNSDTYSFELAKASGGSLTFTLDTQADITVTASSTGQSNDSWFTLKCDGEALIPKDGATGDVTVSGSSATDISYEAAPAGSYTLTSSADSSRGVRIIDVTVQKLSSASTTVYVLDPEEWLSGIEKKATVAPGTYGDDNYFTLSGSATRGNSDTCSFELAKDAGGKISFTVTGTADVTVNATSTGKTNDSSLSLINSEGSIKPDSADDAAVSVIGTDPVTTVKYSGLTAGEYSVVSTAGFTARGVRILGITVEQTASGTRPPRLDWSQVADPVITGIETSSSGKIVVNYDMVTGYDGADSVQVVFTGYKTDVKAPVNGTDGKAEYAPLNSDRFTVQVVASRGEETPKTSEAVDYEYTLPLGTASIMSVYNKGNGVAAVEWTAVKEVTGYEVSYSCDDQDHDGKISVSADTTVLDIPGLHSGHTYVITVKAVRSETDFTTSAPEDIKVTEEAQTKWGYIVYGNGANTNNAAYSGDVNEDGKVTLRSGKIGEDGKLLGSGNNGKWMPDSNDGINFYYTEVPSSLNFTLRALVHVDQWYLSNAQEAFGLMANDALGGNGWNNSVAAAATKVEYSVVDVTDEDGKVVSQKFLPKTSGLTSYSQKLGIYSQAKTGLTKDMFTATGEPSSDTAKILSEGYALDRYVLEQRFNESGNVIGNSVNNVAAIEGSNIVDMYLTIQKNNTGYFVTYETPDGKFSATKKYYDPSALSVLDPESVYVGFFTSRYAQATFSDITFKVVDPSDDAPAEERPVEKIPVTANFVSPKATGIADYTFRFNANCDGKLVISSEYGLVMAEKEISANTVTEICTTVLSDGDNNYRYAFTPDASYVPGEFQIMESYDVIEGMFTVKYELFGAEGSSLYVAPDANGSGSKEDPMSIYDAVRFVRPGQYIIIMEGTYNLTSTVVVDRGIDGTAEDPIYMIADPEASTRPVFDFGKNCAGMIFAGNYWVAQGFDVTNSADGQKGLQVSGSNNIFVNINTYHNGNTGFQISRYRGSDEYDMWPSRNVVLNCTSYGNADSGYEDADGFAAKLTVGDANMFIGCIAYNNADDGWDLYAKIQTGRIGTVVISNCVAYGNGYLEDGTDAGNGNGFKLGGDSMPGGHLIIDSVAFNNKSKGIDSNSCPDIAVRNCTSFNNGSYNVAMYTNTAVDTVYSLSGVLSYRNSALESALATVENLKGKGAQIEGDIYGTTNYYWDGTSSKNTEGKEVAENWFVSTETFFDAVTHTFSKAPVTRNADYSINMNGLLVLTEAAPEATGAVVKGLSTDPITDIPDFVYSYKILEGADQVIGADSDKNVRIRIDAPLTQLVCVKVDDIVTSENDYSAVEGSTIITFKEAFIESLAEGSHIIRAEFSDDKYAETTLTITKDNVPTDDDSLPAGDTGRMLIYILTAISALTATGMIVFRKKEN